MTMAMFLSLIFMVVITSVLAYLYLLVLAAIRPSFTQPSQHPQHRFAIAIPAHDEEAVIGHTVARLQQIDYPKALFDIHVVADHCSDQTAALARMAGAVVHERNTTPRGSKGAALRWLFAHILNEAGESSHDAVLIFDADTQVDANFLRIMDARLAQGDQVIQGQHRIGNPFDGWFPALTWAMFIIDNRYQNLGRSNLGWSAKHMGDSICFRTDILRQFGWGEGLTEDYAFRQQLLLNGIKIRYEPAAIGYGEAAATWQIARAQRARWLQGTYTASRQYGQELLLEGIRRCDLALLDGGLQAYLPSYSTLTMITWAIWLVHLILWLIGQPALLAACTVLLTLLIIYPLVGLALDRAPLKAYVAIFTGPMFILWRTWLALTTRWGRRQVHWVRTPRKVA